MNYLLSTWTPRLLLGAIRMTLLLCGWGLFNEFYLDCGVQRAPWSDDISIAMYFFFAASFYLGSLGAIIGCASRRLPESVERRSIALFVALHVLHSWFYGMLYAWCD